MNTLATPELPPQMPDYGGDVLGLEPYSPSPMAEIAGKAAMIAVLGETTDFIPSPIDTAPSYYQFPPMRPVQLPRPQEQADIKPKPESIFTPTSSAERNPVLDGVDEALELGTDFLMAAIKGSGKDKPPRRASQMAQMIEPEEPFESVWLPASDIMRNTDPSASIQDFDMANLGDASSGLSDVSSPGMGEGGQAAGAASAGPASDES